jgi:hypothetical protein
LGAVYFFPDHLEAEVIGAPRLNISLEEVGMKGVSTGAVGGGILPAATRAAVFDLAA